MRSEGVKSPFTERVAEGTANDGLEGRNTSFVIVQREAIHQPTHLPVPERG